MAERHHFSKHAPGFLGAFLCALALLTGGCERRSHTPDWTPALEAKAVVDTPDPEPAKAAPKRRGGTPAVDATPAETTGSLRFVSYNVHNWIVDSRQVNGQRRETTKPEASKQAVVTVLAGVNPDIVGLCEIGTHDDLADLQARLKAAGLDLPHSHHTGGSDPSRHLALLSRFPITATASPEKSEYRLEGRTFTLQRGILDATVTADGKAYRFLGAHLKSKRESEDADQSQMRHNEAHLLRAHLESILKTDPATRLIVYGDLNDTKASPSLKTIQGSYNHPDYLTALSLKDRQGQSWTHYWESEDIYSRFDWILVSRMLKPEIDAKASRIIDATGWEKASDHRPVMMVVE